MAQNTNSLALVAASSQYASHADAAAYRITGDITFEIWVKFTSLPTSGNDMYFFSRWFIGSTNSYLFGIHNTAGTYSLTLTTHSGSGNDSISKNITTPTLNTWYHFAVSRVASTSTASFYVNAVSQGTATGTNTSISSGDCIFAVGAADNGGSFVDGLVDEPRVWASTRSGSDISTNYQQELVGNESGLNAYYKFNNTANDATSNGNTLTLNGSPSYSSDVPFTNLAVVGGDVSYSFFL